jgi:hypothetical protein
MGVQLFANNANATLASGITNVATSMSLASGKGALFPNPSGGDWFLLTLTQAGIESSWEIVKCTARSTDTLTIVRAQEGTTGLAWATADKAELRLTAGSFIAPGAATMDPSTSMSVGSTGHEGIVNLKRSYDGAVAGLLSTLSDWIFLKCASAGAGISFMVNNAAKMTINDTSINPLVPIAIPSVTALTLANSWANFGSGYDTGGYWKDAFGIVHLQGVIYGGTVNTTICTALPSGYRPTAHLYVAAICNGAMSDLIIGTDGNITIQAAGTGILSLVGITFRTT